MKPISIRRDLGSRRSSGTEKVPRSTGSSEPSASLNVVASTLREGGGAAAAGRANAHSRAAAERRNIFVSGNGRRRPAGPSREAGPAALGERHAASVNGGDSEGGTIYSWAMRLILLLLALLGAAGPAAAQSPTMR